MFRDRTVSTAPFWGENEQAHSFWIPSRRHTDTPTGRRLCFVHRVALFLFFYQLRRRKGPSTILRTAVPVFWVRPTQTLSSINERDKGECGGFASAVANDVLFAPVGRIDRSTTVEDIFSGEQICSPGLRSLQL